MTQRKTGTREWAEINKNILNGCEHNCLYCYARHNAERFKRLPAGGWDKPIFRADAFNEKVRNYSPKRIMFPTTHDILPEYADRTVEYLEKWLKAGNEILIVSKPHKECIYKICDNLYEYKDQIVFRFTIGSMHDEQLKFWEPGAPGFEERFESLKYAFEMGFTTSVSCEPYLDGDITLLVEKLLPYISDTIWIGKMNRINNRVHMKDWTEKERAFLRKVQACQTDSAVREIYNHFIGHKDESKIRWKESMQKVLGIQQYDGVA